METKSSPGQATTAHICIRMKNANEEICIFFWTDPISDVSPGGANELWIIQA